MSRLNLEKCFKGFVSNDELKPALLGVCYDIDNNNLCATDGHKLFVLNDCDQHIVINHADKMAGNPILPVEIFAEYEKRTKTYSKDYRDLYCRLLISGSRSYDDPYFVEYQEKKGENKPFKTFAGAECINENYPDYLSVIPDKNDRGDVDSIGINPVYANMIWQALKSWAPKSNPMITMKFKDARAPIMIDIFRSDVDPLKYQCLLMPIRTI